MCQVLCRMPFTLAKSATIELGTNFTWSEDLYRDIELYHLNSFLHFPDIWGILYKYTSLVHPIIAQLGECHGQIICQKFSKNSLGSG